MRCGSCGAAFALHEYGTTLDDLMEEFLADIPCNRI
ncbi:dual CXXC motif small (seleno)protein [Desulfonatronum sp. SC1]